MSSLNASISISLKAFEGVTLCHCPEVSSLGYAYNVLQGVLYCGHCGSKLYSNRQIVRDENKIYYYYTCWKKQFKFQHKDPCNDFKRVHQDKIIATVKSILIEHVKQALTTSEKLLEYFKSKEFVAVSQTRKGILNGYNDGIIQKNAQKKKLLENYLCGNLNESDYLHFSQIYDNDIAGFQQEIDSIYLTNKEDENLAQKPNWIKLFESFLETEELTNDIVKLLIEKVIIYNPKQIEIVFRYKDEYSKLLSKSIEYEVMINGQI